MASTPGEPTVVRPPLRGEWCAINTPGHRIPSHGTDQLGQRFAFDLLQIDWSNKRGDRFTSMPVWLAVILGVPLDKTFCWSQPIHAPFDGEVVECGDGFQERDPVHILRDFFHLLLNTFTFKADSNIKVAPLLGNYIILKGDSCFALFAHARTGSIRVSPGEWVTSGQQLAQVGHSGNTTAPHLHFQLMDRQDLIKAQGVPCCFDYYESYSEGRWQPVREGIPGRRERVRFVEAST